MTPIFKTLDSTSRSYIVSFALVAVATIGACWFLIGLFAPSTQHPTVLLVLLVGTSLAQVLVFFTLYRIFSENKRVTRTAHELHIINRAYKDSLSQLFSVYEAVQQKNQKLKIEEMLLVERAVLNKVCQHIAAIFWTVTARKCAVTVKLLQPVEDKLVCFTWARSEQDPYRADPQGKFFLVNTGDNTGFDEALKPRDAEPSYFHAGNLLVLAEAGEYHNQRPGWRQLYRSTIVVPIRHKFASPPAQSDDLGFLCVDTMSVNRLNKTYHVELLSAFADQMYNFLSIMRHKYVLVGEEQNNPLSTSV